MKAYPASPHLALKISLLMVVVVFMGNLGAMVDFIMHPEIEYFDEEHLIVGGITAMMATLLFGALMIYVQRQEKLVLRHQEARLIAIENEKKFKEIFEKTHDVLFVSNPEGFFEEINPAGVELFGFNSREEMLHIKTSDLYASVEERERQRSLLEQSGFFRDHEIQMKRKNGSSLVMSVTAEVVRDDFGKVVSFRGSMRDLTSQKLMESQLLQSQKMESIGRLAGGVAHDFNNYLTTIRGYTELAIMALPEDSSIKPGLVEARRAADEAAELAGQLLLFSRHQMMEMRPLNLNRVIEGLCPMVQRLVGDDKRVISALAADLHSTTGDIGNLSQAIVNLALNASSYMPRGGDITITTCNRSVVKEYIEDHPQASIGDFVTISVSDTSSGMTERELAHVFEPFYKLEGGKGDVGLGLAAVYGIILQHEGWIEVESIRGTGTTFTVFLPAAASLADVGEDESFEPDDLSSDGGRILLVEDDDAVRAITEKMLRVSGYEVVGAHDAAEAFARFAGEKGDFQMVFSDVALPGEDGVTLAENLQLHKPELAVLLGSGYSDTAVDWDRVQSHGYRLLQKPYVMPDLLRVIRELMVNTS